MHKLYWNLKMLVLAVIVVLSLDRVTVLAEERETDYERDYISQIYNSENGLEGTAVNCICPSEKGFIWLGGYTGLYRYDGTELKKYLIGKRSFAVNDIIEDRNGTLWVGTNGEGIYYFDGKDFVKYEMKQESDAEGIITKLFLDSEGMIYAGTKNGLFRINPEKKEQQAFEYPLLKEMEIRDINEMSAKEIVIIEKSGKIFLAEGSDVKEVKENTLDEENRARCLSKKTDDYVYIGTKGSSIFKVSNGGEIQKRIDGDGLNGFNAIYEFEKGKFWVCSENGIGILQNDKVTRLHFEMDDSVEEVCTDYQGSYWFASSRQGIMQIYQNGFSDLGKYWQMKQTINSIQTYKGKMYVAGDNGLYCYQGKEQIEDALTKLCQGIRVRQIYKDKEENLWIATSQNGIKVLKNTGETEEYNAENSGLTTNQIRCIREDDKGRILFGTEEGIFTLTQEAGVERLVNDEELNSRRVLDLADYNGSIYAATDGYGLYEIKEDKVKAIYSKQKGLSSSAVMKVVPSERMNGIWLVTGGEINFWDKNGTVQKVKGLDNANSLDLLLTSDGEVLILAGNGIFRAKETELLKEKPSYIKINRNDGLPIDFTAYAGNQIKDGVVYMCGTTGAASMDLQSKKYQRDVRIYLNEATADGKAVEIKKKNKVIVPSRARQVRLDVRCMDFAHQNLKITYQLEGIDKKPVTLEDDEKKESIYTNLSGGRYHYQYRIYDEQTGKNIAQTDVKVFKEYRLWEIPEIRRLIVCIVIVSLILFNFLIVLFRERAIKNRYRIRLQEEKEEEMKKLAYTDLVTGAYNRNRFEQKKAEINMERLYALFCVSVNHREYILNKYGLSVWEALLGKAAQSLKECMSSEIELYRISDNVFIFWSTEPVNLEEFIHKIKEQFESKGEKEAIPYSLAIGGVYNNKMDKEKINDLLERCENMRLLDAKHAEAKFIESKMKIL